jgi:hypothetical protein
MDAYTYRYLYRRRFNIPRVPVERTDELTNYEFEYEWLLEKAFYDIQEDIKNKREIRTSDGSFARNLSTDEDEYQRIIEMIENGEEVDLEIPDEPNEGNPISVLPKEEDQVPVDLNRLFGR